MNELFEPGSFVKVTLLKKNTLYYSKNLPHVGEFKENLIKKVFQTLGGLREIKQTFVVGSFLTKNTDYGDVDLLIVCNKKISEDKISSILADKIGINFHIFAVSDLNFEKLMEMDPLTRSMLYSFASNKPFSISKTITFDKNHINFLLMMPQDLLKISASSRVFYDSLRRLLSIQRFLENKSLNSLEIEQELKTLLKNLFSLAKNNEPLPPKLVNEIRKIIKLKLGIINNLIVKWERKE